MQIVFACLSISLALRYPMIVFKKKKNNLKLNVIIEDIKQNSKK